MFKLTLALKFKLSAELLLALNQNGPATNHGNESASRPNHLLAASNQRNQSQSSKWRRQQQRRAAGPSATSASADQSAPQLGQMSPYQLQRRADRLELSLQCKYKLTEVSDVTFNELVAREPAASSPVGSEAAPGQPAEPLAAELAEQSGVADQEAAATTDSRLAHQPAGWMAQESGLILGKSAHNQVTQSESPASGRQLWLALQALKSGAQDACQLASSLVLLPDDPLIVEPDGDDSEEPLAGGARGRRQLVKGGSAGDLISANCSTIGALLAQAAPSPSKRPLVGGRRRRPNNGQVEPVSYCGDQVARGRPVVSGKYQPNEDRNFNQRQQSPGRPLGGFARQQAAQSGARYVAYLSLAGVSSATATATADKDGKARADGSSSGAEPGGGLRTAAGQQRAPGTSADSSRSSAPPFLQPAPAPGWPDAEEALLAPPLLEWFINNQEVSGHVCHYLAALAAHSRGRRQVLGAKHQVINGLLRATIRARRCANYCIIWERQSETNL